MARPRFGMSASRSVGARRRRVFEAVALAVCCALALFGLGVPTSVGISAAVADEGQSSAATLDPPDTSDPAAPKALPDAATANSNSWMLPDGEMRTDVYGAPVNYQKPSGDWAPIDNQLVDSSASGVAVTNAANDYSAALPEDAGSKPVRFSADDRWVSFQMRGLDGSPDVSGTKAVYTDASDADAVAYQATARPSRSPSPSTPCRPRRRSTSSTSPPQPV